jgi:broad specificity phosphatase PhoE
VTGGDRAILLARHGETEWNRIGRWQGATDIPLSDVGRQQARALAERLFGQPIRRVYASHLSRARETAEIIVTTLGLSGPVSIDPRLRERGYGCFEGLTREECALRHPGAWERYLADRRAVPPDAEPQDEVVARFTAAMDAVARDADAGVSTLVISHGGSIRSFVHAAVGVVLPPLGNGAIVRLVFGDGRFSLADEAG